MVCYDNYGLYNLTWKDHVFELCEKISKSIGIYKLRDSVSIDILFKVYYSVIYTFFMHAVLVWDIHTQVICTHFDLAKEGYEDNDISGFSEHTSPII
jgi:hypothetical protein